MPRVDVKALVRAWVASELAEDDLVSGRVPTFAVVDKREIRPGAQLTALHSQEQREVQVDLPPQVSLAHALDHAAGNEPFVRRLAAQLLNDAAGAPPVQIASFEAKLLLPFAPKPPAGLIFSVAHRGVPALRTLRVPVTFSVALHAGEVVLVEHGSEARYSIGDADAVEVPPHLVRVLLPTLLYRLGRDRPRVRRLTVADPNSIAIPRNGRLPF